MELIPSLNTFLDQVNTFYEVNDRSNTEKLIIMVEAREMVVEISKHQKNEHARLIINIRRLFINTLPHHGFEERINLEASLNAILETCREYITIL